jgi:hypothetical protein
LIAADGSTVWIRDEGRVVGFDERGQPSEWQGIMLDVTGNPEPEALVVDGANLPAGSSPSKPASTPAPTGTA